jgi:3,2-trans-enoyl-CoA isomerase
MALRNGIRGFSIFSSSFRNYSSTGPVINLQVNDKTGVATVTLNRPPVNSLNLELLTELSNTLTELEKNKCRGLMLTSSSNSVFSAGLDLLELYKPNLDRFKQWWSTLQQTWMKLYGTPYPTVAVINGHAPAGGCLLATSCEYRVMLNNFTIGLNETKIGMVAPDWFIASMKNTVGARQTELALTAGNLFTTDEALKIGLIDEVAVNKEEAISKAEKFLHRYDNVSPLARALTKQTLRKDAIQDLVKKQKTELENITSFINNEKLQKGLEVYLESLKQKKKQ